jgi:ubiquinone/menaquinone biosynthesis C-methylase UbiE
MSCETASAAFNLGDLAVFDETHLRELIGAASGTVPPELVGCALAFDNAHADQSVADLATRIERVLAPDDRQAFVRARRGEVTADNCAAACRIVLDRLFWEMMYWKTPYAYERLIAGEQVHLGTLEFARVYGAAVLDAGAGTGRITLPLARHARRVYALDPAPPLLTLLDAKLSAADLRNVELLRGSFRRVPLPDDSVDAVVSCSAFGPQEARGGQGGLDELMRVTRPGGRIVVIWPEDPAWFARHGFHYAILPGHLTTTFPTLEEARWAATHFYGADAVRYLEATRRPELPFQVRGVKAPRDVCWLTVEK